MATSDFDGSIDSVSSKSQHSAIAAGAMGEHWFYPSAQAETDVYVRYYLKQLPGFVMGHEKMVHLKLASGDSGPISSKYFGAGTINVQVSLTGGESGWLFQNVDEITLENDKWYYIEQYFKSESSAGASDGEYQIWIDDCGANASGCDGLSGTLRGCRVTDGCANSTGIDWGTQAPGWGHLWFENWGNPGSDGEQHYDNLVVSKVRVGTLAASASSGVFLGVQ